MEWLEDTHMKNVMYAGALRQLQLVGDLAHAFDDLVGAGVTRTELGAVT